MGRQRKQLEPHAETDVMSPSETQHGSKKDTRDMQTHKGKRAERRQAEQ